MIFFVVRFFSLFLILESELSVNQHGVMAKPCIMVIPCSLLFPACLTEQVGYTIT